MSFEKCCDIIIEVQNDPRRSVLRLQRSSNVLIKYGIRLGQTALKSDSILFSVTIFLLI